MLRLDAAPRLHRPGVGLRGHDLRPRDELVDGDGWWLAAWKADNARRNTCRKVTIAINDGSTITTTVMVV